jgi:hypothetical protein
MEMLGESHKIQKVLLKPNYNSLDTSIRIHVEQQIQQPTALTIVGLESVKRLDKLLIFINQIRDEFRKPHPFPMEIWLNKEVL